LDADKEGFLRSTGSLIQTIGRAARHLKGCAILYADVMTDSMRRAIEETNRRRGIQRAYNEENHITPQSIIKPIDMSLVAIAEADYVTVPLDDEPADDAALTLPERDRLIAELETHMKDAARKFEFERAAQLRDRIKALRSRAPDEQVPAHSSD
jgi:excinuclease ABC subunit B